MSINTYQKRRDSCENPLLRKLFNIILEKKSNLCVAANFKTLEEVLDYVDQAGKHICILKIQLGRYGLNNTVNYLEKLYEKKREHNFLLFEDPKYNDSYETIRTYYENIVKYIDIVTVDPIYEGGIRAIQEAAAEANLPDDEPRGCFAVCETSFENSRLLDANHYLSIAERHPESCIGIIAQTLRITNDSSMIKATPGVNISRTSDGKGQNWKHPVQAVANGADVVIVGRGIISVPKGDLENTTREYKEISWKAYCDSLM